MNKWVYYNSNPLDFMSGVHGMMKQMFKDADCREEREIIQNWARKIAEM